MKLLHLILICLSTGCGFLLGIKVGTELTKRSLRQLIIKTHVNDQVTKRYMEQWLSSL